MLNNHKQLTHSSSSPSSKSYKTVRLKVKIHNSTARAAIVLLYLLAFCVKRSQCNRPPRFLLEGQSEIVLRLKEGPETSIDKPIYRLRGVDPDGDALEFGIRNSYESDILRIENVGMNEADIYLTRELDREVSGTLMFTCFIQLTIVFKLNFLEMMSEKLILTAQRI